MKLFQSLAIASLLMALGAATGCMGTSDVSDDGVGVTGVSIGPDKTTLTTGTTFQFLATVKYADGTSKDVTHDSETVWNTSNPAIATVSDSGMVSAIAEGLVDISADYKGEKGDEHLAITP
jgi:trimeric autotransporter adhesin